MTDRRPPFPPRDPAPTLTHPLTEALGADWPMLFQAQTLLDRMLDRTETGRAR